MSEANVVVFALPREEKGRTVDMWKAALQIRLLAQRVFHCTVFSLVSM